MRSIAFSLLGLLIVGCTATHPAQTLQSSPSNANAETEFEPANASALVFAPAVSSPYPLEGLARGPRQTSAFLGYDQQVSETYVIVSDDEQGNWGWSDGYQRSAVTAKIGVRSR